MGRCSRCTRTATWVARLRVSTSGATTSRSLCDRHADQASESEVLHLVALLRLVPVVPPRSSAPRLESAKRRPLQRRLSPQDQVSA